MSNRDLYALVETAMQGDRGALEALCEIKIKPILYHCMQILENRQDAEDAAQDVLYKMCKGLRSLRAPESFHAWLRKIIENECNRIIRKKYIKNGRVLMLEDTDVQEAVDTEFLPIDFIEDQEKRKALADAVNAMPLKRRQILVMAFYEEMTSAEIAKSLGMPIGTVTSTISRAKTELIRTMEQKFGPAPKNGSEILAGIAIGSAIDGYVTSAFSAEVISKTLVASLARFEGVSLINLSGMTVKAARLGKPLLRRVAAAVVTLVFLGAATLSALSWNSTANHYPDFSPADAMPPSVASSGGNTNEQDKGEANRYFNADIAGTVHFEDRTGNTIANTGLGLSEIGIEVVDANDRVVGTAVTDAVGNYSISACTLQRNASYYVRLAESGNAEVLHTATIASVQTEFRSQNGTSTCEMDIGVLVTQTPLGTLKIDGADCECGHVNPLRVTFVSNDVSIVEQEWTIYDLSGRILRSGGETDSMQAALEEMQNSRQDGYYTLELIVTDIFGNRSLWKFDFLIDTAPNPAIWYE